MQFYSWRIWRVRPPLSTQQIVIKFNGDPSIFQVRNHQRDRVGAQILDGQVVFQILDRQHPPATSNGDQAIEGGAINTRVRVDHLCL
jgi:hypothetical protein